MRLPQAAFVTLTGSLLFGLSLAPGAPSRAGAAPAPPRTAWGEVHHGLQSGIRLAGGRTQFRRGELLPVELVVRNVGKEQRQLDYWGPSSWSFTRESGQKLAIRAVEEETGFARMSVATLPPGAEVTFAETEPAAILRDPAWNGDEMDLSVPTLRLAPGTYHLCAPRPFRGHENGSELRRDALATGSLEIKLLAEPAVESPSVERYRIAWGPSQEGLQTGIALRTPNEPLYLDETATFNLYLRNRGTAARSIEHTRLLDLDYAPNVKSVGGERVTVDYVWLSGLRDRMERTLPPGARALIAHPQIEARRAKAEPAGLVPTFVAAAGPYRISQSFIFQAPGQERTATNLESGELQVRVTAR